MVETFANCWWDEGVQALLGFSSNLSIQIRWTVLLDILCLAVFHFYEILVPILVYKDLEIIRVAKSINSVSNTNKSNK